MATKVLKQRRTQLGLTQQQVASMLGISQQTVARWERGDDVPSKYLKDLAIVLACRLTDLVSDGEIHGGSTFLRLASRSSEVEDDAQVPYGTARAVFMPRPSEGRASKDAENGHKALVNEYPISEGEMKRLYSRLHREDASATWLVFETLDNRIVLINRSELESFEMIGDDVTAMPPFEHEEVYAAFSGDEMSSILDGRAEELTVDDDAAPYSKAFIEYCAKVAEEWGGLDAVLDRVSGVSIETVDGRRENLFSDPDEDAYERINSLVLELDGVQDADRAPVSDWMVEIGTEGYYRSSFYRLGALRLIEVPLYAYTRAWRDAFGLDDGGERDDDA